MMTLSRVGSGLQQDNITPPPAVAGLAQKTEGQLADLDRLLAQIEEDVIGTGGVEANTLGLPKNSGILQAIPTLYMKLCQAQAFLRRNEFLRSAIEEAQSSASVLGKENATEKEHASEVVDVAPMVRELNENLTEIVRIYSSLGKSSAQT